MKFMATKRGGHIAAVRDFLGAEYESPAAVSEELTRALHTIRGSSHMVNETEIANVSRSYGYVFHCVECRTAVNR